eukprot:10704905-Alexandrium_andersonii.AAC.1
MAAPVGASGSPGLQCPPAQCPPCAMPSSRCPPAQFPLCAVPRFASRGSASRGLCVAASVTRAPA